MEVGGSLPIRERTDLGYDQQPTVERCHRSMGRVKIVCRCSCSRFTGFQSDLRETFWSDPLFRSVGLEPVYRTRQARGESGPGGPGPQVSASSYKWEAYRRRRFGPAAAGRRATSIVRSVREEEAAQKIG